MGHGRDRLRTCNKVRDLQNYWISSTILYLATACDLLDVQIIMGLNTNLSTSVRCDTPTPIQALQHGLAWVDARVKAVLGEIVQAIF